MSFFSRDSILAIHNTNPCAFIYDSVIDKQYSYLQLQELIDQQIAEFEALFPSINESTSETLPRCFITLFACNNIRSLVCYLAALQTNAVVLLQDSMLAEEKKQKLINDYPANLVFDNSGLALNNENTITLESELSLLLTTSGSTGTAKLVKLSSANLNANAHAICDYLPIKKSDVVVTSLPCHYSFGLSIINTHLLKGASIVLTDTTPMQKEFWQLYKQFQPQSFYGVPFSYQLIIQLRLNRLALSSVQYFAQAGGRLDDKLLAVLTDYAKEQQKQVFVMYGQTEATARIAYLTPDKLPNKIGKIGQAIPGGELALFDDNGEIISKTNSQGELRYKGPNICLGVAENIAQLGVNTSVTVDGYLCTGDLAIFDDDGDFKITGRIKRFIKITGKRVNLDEIELWISANFDIEQFAVSGEDDLLTLFYTANTLNIDDIFSKLADYLQIHSRYLFSQYLDELPRLGNGKTDYQLLKQSRH